MENRNEILQSHILDKSIRTLIQESHLPISSVYFILKNIYVEIEKLYNETVELQLIEYNKPKKEPEIEEIEINQSDR